MGGLILFILSPILGAEKIQNEFMRSYLEKDA